MKHDYTVRPSVHRAKLGRVLGIVSAGVASGLVAALLWSVDALREVGVPVPDVLLPPIGAALVFTVLYWLLDRHLWRFAVISRLLGVPNLAGRWAVTGESLGSDRNVKYKWSGELTIVQSFDQIRIRLTTPSSTSDSVTAALTHDEGIGYRLVYSYKNQPAVDQPPDLHAHPGFAALDFDIALSKATGEYFNGLDRFTFGKMTLTRKPT